MKLISTASVVALATIAASSDSSSARDSERDHIDGCNTTSCDERVTAKMTHRRATARRRAYQRSWVSNAPAVRAHLRRIARCESGGNHRAISAGGAYRGLLQFDYRTWASVGGHGDPAAASRWEQWARGGKLYRSRGSQPWPVCQYR